MVEPISLDDYEYGETDNLPLTISNLLDCFDRMQVQPNRFDILAGLVRILMLECGFVDYEFQSDVDTSLFAYRNLLELSQTLPASWKENHDQYKFVFVLKMGADAMCTLRCVKFGDDFLVNCLVRNRLENFSIILEPLNYIVLMSESNKWMFQGLRQLSRVFKDEIANLTKVSLLRDEWSFIGGCNSLLDLPQEILLYIVSCLRIEDVLNLARTSQRFALLLQDQCLWIKLLKRSGKRMSVEEMKRVYEDNYRKQLERIVLNM